MGAGIDIELSRGWSFLRSPSETLDGSLDYYCQQALRATESANSTFNDPTIR